MNTKNTLKLKLQAFLSAHMKHTRKSLGDSQEKMAAKLDVSYRTYVDQDQGKTLCSTLAFVRYLVVLYKAGKVLPFIESLAALVDEVDEADRPPP